MNEQQIERAAIRARAIIDTAERVLDPRFPLTPGQRRDLLKSNTRWRSEDIEDIVNFLARALTLTIVRRLLREIDISITHKDGEYRVNFRRGREATAYYTNDLEDALNTGIAMKDAPR